MHDKPIPNVDDAQPFHGADEIAKLAYINSYADKKTKQYEADVHIALSSYLRMNCCKLVLLSHPH